MTSGITVEEGRVSRGSRLYRHLTDPDRARAMKLGVHPKFSLKKLGGSHPVFLLRDRVSKRLFVLKSFQERGVPSKKLRRRMKLEYERLKFLASLDVGRGYARAVRPICRDTEGLFLVEEFVHGLDLGHYAVKSLRNCCADFYRTLNLLSGFLGGLHLKTATEGRAGLNSPSEAIEKHSEQAFCHGSVSVEDMIEIRRLARVWSETGAIADAKKSFVHGDATVSNFIFRDGRMFVIDVERARYADPVFDLGMMAGEIFNKALICTGNPYAADPFIGHMYWVYSGNFADQLGTFRRLTARNPFYMANSLLRISRNMYYPINHRQTLAQYALRCLQSRLPD
ncbi:MAG TPA: aminoglycoside phosphotransferase family protein [Methanocella sp.]|nr:aminoglycoside phosphotransferase family protein [Methanocella sp.]